MAAVAIYCTDPKQGDSLRRTLRGTSEIAVAGLAADAAALARLLQQMPLDAVLADRPSADQVQGWRKRHPALAIVALIADGDAESALDLIHAGASAVLPRGAVPKEVAMLIVAAARGLAILPRDTLEALIDANAPAPPASLAGEAKAAMPLTPRELEVLAAMADGASNKAIARRLGISFHTAKFHVAAILAKLDADSRTEAVAKAAHLGVVML